MSILAKRAEGNVLCVQAVSSTYTKGLAQTSLWSAHTYIDLNVVLLSCNTALPASRIYLEMWLRCWSYHLLSRRASTAAPGAELEARTHRAPPHVGFRGTTALVCGLFGRPRLWYRTRQGDRIRQWYRTRQRYITNIPCRRLLLRSRGPRELGCLRRTLRGAGYDQDHRHGGELSSGWTAKWGSILPLVNHQHEAAFSRVNSPRPEAVRHSLVNDKLHRRWLNFNRGFKIMTQFKMDSLVILSAPN